MGEKKAREERLHRRKLWNGRCTSEEVWRQHLPQDARCGGCGSSKVAMRVRTFVPLDWLLNKAPQLAMEIAAKNEGRLHLVDFTHGKHVRVGDAFACDLCKKALEQEAAKAPSHVTVQIDRGPGPDNPIVQVVG